MDASRKPVSLIPLNDEERLRKLYKYEILDTPADKTFDKIATLAAQIFDTPNAFVTFVDHDRVFFKAKVSTIDGADVIAEEAISTLAVLNVKTTFFADIHTAPELQDIPAVAVDNSVRFYAATPIKSLDGYLIGTVSVADAVPKVATPKQLKMLENLSELIVDELELRQTTRNIVRVQTDLMNIAVHDIKNPLTAISLYSKILGQRSEEEYTKNLSGKIHNASLRILDDLNELLSLSRIENGAMMLKFENTDTGDLLKKVISSLHILAQQKQQTIILHHNCSKIIRCDAGRIQEVFENLLSNAIKYAYIKSEINIFTTERDGNLMIEFRDQGQGLNELDMQKLFTKFARLSAVPTNKEVSHGLGLSIAKILVELHNGKIWAESKGKNLGASFFVLLPLTQNKV